MVRFFSCVYAQMTLKCLQVPESCATDFAGIWLLSCVDQDVGTQVSHLNTKYKMNILTNAIFRSEISLTQ